MKKDRSSKSENNRKFFKSSDKKNQKFRRSNQTFNLPEDFFRIEGISAINEFFSNKPELIREIHASNKDYKKIESLIESARKKFPNKEFPKIKSITNESKADDKSVEEKEVSHIVVQLQTVGWKSFVERVKRKKPAMIVICDHITDPRNLGAMVRNCAFFGVPFVIVPERRQAMLTHSCVSTSQGGFAWVELVNASNIARCCEELKELNFWLVGTDMNGQDIKAFRRPSSSPLAVVMGNENEGISRLVLEKCDEVVSLSGAEERIESLNVSVACGIALHEFFHTKL